MRKTQDSLEDVDREVIKEASSKAVDAVVSIASLGSQIAYDDIEVEESRYYYKDSTCKLDDVMNTDIYAVFAETTNYDELNTLYIYLEMQYNTNVDVNIYTNLHIKKGYPVVYVVVKPVKPVTVGAMDSYYVYSFPFKDLESMVFFLANENILRKVVEIAKSVKSEGVDRALQLMEIIEKISKKPGSIKIPMINYIEKYNEHLGAVGTIAFGSLIDNIRAIIYRTKPYEEGKELSILIKRKDKIIEPSFISFYEESLEFIIENVVKTPESLRTLIKHSEAASNAVKRAYILINTLRSLNLLDIIKAPS